MPFSVRLFCRYALRKRLSLYPNIPRSLRSLPSPPTALRTVMVGNVKLGSEHPIVRQTMTTSDTRDVEATVAEVRPLHALSYLQDTVCAVTK